MRARRTPLALAVTVAVLAAPGCSRLGRGPTTEPSRPVAERDAAAGDDGAGADATSEPTEAPELNPVLLDESPEAFHERTVVELKRAQDTIDRLALRELGDDGVEILDRARTFVTAAREALAARDVRRAANLTRKATVLLGSLD